jgi:glycosyltransferase involved in cell wall biosynthesis
MDEQLRAAGWRFEVWFMARSESERHWSFENSDFHFTYRFLRGKRFRIRSSTLYWNREITQALREVSPEVLLIAGAWVHPTVLLASLSSGRCRRIFWSESHLESIRHGGPIIDFLRRCMLSRFSEFAVPGRLARKYVEHYSPGARIYSLPNVVDPCVFHNQAKKDRSLAKIRIAGEQRLDRRVLLVVARLAEEKGVHLFLEGIEELAEADRSKLTVLIAGSGPLQSTIARWIARHSVDVRLLGQQTESQMAELYGGADGFCLPSTADPNPISVIEALCAGLPMLLSSRVGNHPECLQEGINGFLLFPHDPESVASAVSKWLSLSRAELIAFGENSLRIARNNFDPDSVISNFLDQALTGAARSAQPQIEVPTTG